MNTTIIILFLLMIISLIFIMPLFIVGKRSDERAEKILSKEGNTYGK